ncbi:MAG: hypothetical protein AAFQ66_08485 [Pseudomonadota bacterium]
MTPERNLDCRGLSEAIAVLRIKQALECAPEARPKLRAQISKECCPNAVRVGLRSDAHCVSLMEAD